MLTPLYSRWTTCPPGQYNSVSHSSTRNRNCVPVPEGHYTDRSNLNAPIPFTVCQAPNEYVSLLGTTTSNRICADCPKGSFTVLNNEPGLSKCRSFEIDVLPTSSALIFSIPKSLNVNQSAITLAQYDFGQSKSTPVDTGNGSWTEKVITTSGLWHGVYVIGDLNPGSRYFLRATPFAGETLDESKSYLRSQRNAVQTTCGCEFPPVCPDGKFKTHQGYRYVDILIISHKYSFCDQILPCVVLNN